MYELADDAAQADLLAAHHRGVAVRIILDKAFHGQQVNQAAYDQLTAAGISVQWGGAGQIVHQKTVVDCKTAWIGTGNLTSKYYGTTRYAWISDTNPTQVKAIAGTFQADWASPNGHSGNAVGAPGLGRVPWVLDSGHPEPDSDARDVNGAAENEFTFVVSGGHRAVAA